MSMSEESKVTTQAAPPTESFSVHREPSSKEHAWEKNTLQPTLEKSPERQAEFTTVSGYPIRRLICHTGILNVTSVFPVSRRIRAASIPRCTAGAFGPCASSRDSAPPKTPTSDSVISSPRDKLASPPLSIFPP